MKDIFTIIIRLTLACIMAGLVMGTTYIFTSNAKKHNEHVNEQKAMYGLLGYGPTNQAPDSMALHAFYRYIVSHDDLLHLGYLVPLQDTGFSFVTIDLDGNFVAARQVDITDKEAIEEEARHQAIAAVLDEEATLRYADKTIVATNNGRRQAYLLPGAFPGFKTFIHVMLALDPHFTVLGLEIMEHEEDPGLGGEIEKDYFKNQFIGKPYEVLKSLDVTKTPLPDDYRRVLEADRTGMNADDVRVIQEQYQDKDIYALTGATISSQAVTTGARSIVKKFAYRLGILDKVLAQKNIAVPF